MSEKMMRQFHVRMFSRILILVLQFELGIKVNLSNPPHLPAVDISLSKIVGNLNQAGVTADMHAAIGIFIVVLALVEFITAFQSKNKIIKMFGIIVPILAFMAAGFGIAFVMSGFQTDAFSFWMATLFIVIFGLSFLELYLVRPQKSEQGKLTVQS